MKPIVLIITCSALLISCLSDNSRSEIDDYSSMRDNNKNIKVDTAKLNNIINEIYNWVLIGENVPIAFPYNYNDSLIVGVNFNYIDSIENIFKRNGLFTNEFINNHRNIYLVMDKKIKNNKFSRFEIPPFFGNSDPWCLCQDYPYDKRLFVEMIDYSIETIEDTIYYKWNWLNKNNPNYLIKIISEDSTYKVTHMDGFTLDNLLD